MKTNEKKSILRVAVITTLLTVTVFYMISTLNGEIEKKNNTSLKHLTEIKLKNLTLNVRFKEKKIKAGETPEILVDILNNSSKNQKCTFEIGINTMNEVSRMSRMMPFPRKAWSKSIEVSLSSKEKKSITLKSDYKKKEKENLSIFIIEDGKKMHSSPGNIPLTSQTLNELLINKKENE